MKSLNLGSYCFVLYWQGWSIWNKKWAYWIGPKHSKWPTVYCGPVKIVWGPK